MQRDSDPSRGLGARFVGRTVIVTGAASGIGEATALAFAGEGAAVVVADRSSEGAAKVADRLCGQGVRAVAVGCDVTRAEDAARAADAALALGGVDVLVNNAGIGHAGSVLGTDEATWDRLMSVNVKGMFLMARAVLPSMIAQKRGAIVNTASIAGLRGLPDRAAYCTTKFAVVGLTKAMALDHVKDGIRVNCVCPGTTETPWIAERLAEAADPSATRAALVARQPMGRLGTPEEMAAAILFLASDESSFTTGTALTVDGGFVA